MNATKTTASASEIKAQMDALQSEYAEAQRRETDAALAVRFTTVTEHMQLVSAAIEQRDPQAVRTTVSDLSAYVRSTFGKTTSGGGTGQRATHDGPPIKDQVGPWLAANDGDHSPTQVAKALGLPSSGAVGNALESMVKAGTAQRTSDKPKRYAAV